MFLTRLFLGVSRPFCKKNSTSERIRFQPHCEPLEDRSVPVVYSLAQREIVLDLNWDEVRFNYNTRDVRLTYTFFLPDFTDPPFRSLKAIGDINERLRSATTILRRALAADHFEGKGRLSDIDFLRDWPDRVTRVAEVFTIHFGNVAERFEFIQRTVIKRTGPASSGRLGCAPGAMIFLSFADQHATYLLSRGE
jgi:hypothetical protein